MITLTGIDKFFGSSQVLHGIDLSLREGSVTALIGPSGSGKSTLLRCVNLLEIPQAGRLKLGEAEIDFSRQARPHRKQIQAIRVQTGMVFQSFQLFPHLSVIANVMEGLITVQGWQPAAARERAGTLLEKVGMSHKANVAPATLSGGQQQRVAIARALAPSPRVLLCDEPTSALDPELAQEVVAVLRQLASEGTTMLMATHDLRLAANVAQQVVFLESGRIVEQGPAQQIFATPQQQRTRAFVATLTGGVPENWEI